MTTGEKIIGITMGFFIGFFAVIGFIFTLGKIAELVRGSLEKTYFVETQLCKIEIHKEGIYCFQSQ